MKQLVLALPTGGAIAVRMGSVLLRKRHCMDHSRRHLLTHVVGTAAVLALPALAQVQGTPLKFGVGMFQPDREKNDATYRPLAQHLSQRLGRPVELRTVDSWEDLAKSLANGEADVALMGPWGYVLANHFANAQVVSTILYQGKPKYFAMMVTHPDSGSNSIQDLLGPKGKGRSFAFGDTFQIAGKSTLLRLLAGLVDATAGEVPVLGRPAHDLAQQEIGLLQELYRPPPARPDPSPHASSALRAGIQPMNPRNTPHFRRST